MYKFKIEGLSCMGCFNRINESFKNFDAKIKAQVDVPTKTISVETNHTADQVKNLIENAGYVAKNITID